MTDHVIPYGRQHITDEDIAAVAEALRSDYLTTGPRVDEFEEKFAAYIGAKYAVAVANGTAALHLCTLALGVGAGTRVITTPITFAASANCVRYCGGEVWFADIDPVTLTLDIEKVRELIASKPRGYFHGIVPVDFGGYPVDLEAYRALADEHDLWIIEDACHAPGGWFTDSKGTKQWCGNANYADLAIFSFHPVKHIASGEGGMITTNDRELYEKLLLLRTHGITRDRGNLRYPDHGGWYMEMQQLGYNYRIPDILCALGISQLSRAAEGMDKRQEIAERYDQAFKAISTEKIRVHGVPGEAIRHAFHLYVIEVADRRGLYDYLRDRGVFAQVHYVPVHTMPYYRDIGYEEADLHLSEAYYSRGLSLPMYPALTEQEQQFVVDSVKAFLNA
ncbi:UDP-4-amino-4,6-dideoxy-N-acetyl-beta-L-altrosamine transaminase [Neolewinella xylanilytica]|uniref:UDP-4-amino-4, 6-dideoxy-N-acetyl-beta-L-altrosamine transaminase n=1 Tax=Neolewinella xylanilytica TaxID=1514080 RepID=A0A2S6I913_9BACT|nr:UDP-4-amino-4,6-dideoxy-N-acetyl-beta-L-altrosamine transaminase [Neolewinella xylanilytica]PPK87981.1 UDP-4-amino-4,6-dideoxy-N-acetyl-beta-L-altrosamine transaminase [Neolewinella xylanilytica]